MSERELNRIEVLGQVIRGRMTATSAADVLGLSRRQVHRLRKVIESEGAAAIRHKARGRASNNRIDPGIRDYAVALVRERYADFGPTLAAETLAERHDLKVSRETLRKWMQADGIWLSRKQRRTFHQPRLRRECSGRADSDRRIGPPLVRGSRAAVHAARVRRRRDEPADAAGVRDVREHVQLLRRAGAVSQSARPPSRVLFRQAHGVPGPEPGRQDRPRHDPVRPGAQRVERRDPLRQLLPGQRPCRTREPHAPGSAREGTAPRGHLRHGGGQRVPPWLRGPLQCSFREDAAQTGRSPPGAKRRAGPATGHPVLPGRALREHSSPSPTSATGSSSRRTRSRAACPASTSTPTSSPTVGSTSAGRASRCPTRCSTRTSASPTRRSPRTSTSRPSSSTSRPSRTRRRRRTGPSESSGRATRRLADATTAGTPSPPGSQDQGGAAAGQSSDP